MAPGATTVFEYSHKVTEEDLGGVLKNAATASGEPKLPESGSGETGTEAGR